jgi:8-oxo-dGTP pyrophosphatase MutT (NUDIX family)/phosphohistidine phosphatase SixA
MLMGDAAAEDEIRAAGCVLWRPGARGPEVALVHRTRYDDWSLPKGKREPGEHVLETAVREVAEETGIAVILGRRLRSTSYQQDGRRKVVDYWAARAAAAGPEAGFAPNDEVNLLDWLPVPAARARLSYPHDADVLDDFASGPADTFPCILLRHASAGSKDTWAADDLSRPLDAQGRRDAERLAPLLGCYARGRVISAPAQRCVTTIQPYAALAGLAIEIEPAFTVRLAAGAPLDSQLPARRRIEELVAGPAPAVVCAHRENLPLLMDWACARLGAKVPDGPQLHKSSFWVLHIGGGTLACAEHHHISAG